MDPDQELLAEAERIVQDRLELEELGELVRMHASVGRLLAALEARITEVAGGAEV
jgi:hypothetical protein